MNMHRVGIWNFLIDRTGYFAPLLVWVGPYVFTFQIHEDVEMTYDLPRTDSGKVDTDTVIDYLLGDRDWREVLEVITAIDANARKEERERCAVLCEEKIERDAEYGGRFGGYGNFMGDKTGPECATAIRNMEDKT